MASTTNPVTFKGVQFTATSDVLRDSTGAIVPDMKPNDPALFAGKSWYSATITCELPDGRRVIFKASQIRAGAVPLTVAVIP